MNWSFETASRDLKDNKSYQIAIYNDKLIFTNDNAEIYCLDLKNNNIKWSLIFKTSNFENTPLLFKSSPITIDRNGYIFVSTNHGYTYAIDIVSGIINGLYQFILSIVLQFQKSICLIHGTIGFL